jgi:hypothetical protein
LTYNPNEIYHALLVSGEDYADKKAAYLLLDSMTKPQLSGAFYRTMGQSATEKRELMFRDDLYVKHLHVVADARHAYLLSDIKYKSMQALADAKRTEASTRRAEAKYVSMQPS